MTVTPLFDHPIPEWDERRQEISAWMTANPGQFDWPMGAVHNFFHNIIVPPSLRWALKSNDKTASTTIMRALYQVEYGTSFTTQMVAPDDINPQSVVHRQLHADVLRRVHQVRGGIAGLPAALRLTTVRHPSLRAVSAFLYLCKTQESRATWMVNDRIRMGAMVGFDWDQHSRTPEGFVRFLDYTIAWRDAWGPGQINSHWRPQWALIRPDLYRPDLVGRTENLAPFLGELAARLAVPAPDLETTNSQGRYDPSPYLEHPGVRERLAILYRADYETFGYDLDEVPRP